MSDTLPEGYVSDVAIAAGVARQTGPAHPMFRAHVGVMVDATPRPEPPPPVCTVDGVQVDELAVLIKPVAFLVTTDNGVHELTRCYFQKGKLTFGVDLTRIGGISVTGVEYRPEHGLQLHLDKGYEVFVPHNHCQATWRIVKS